MHNLSSNLLAWNKNPEPKGVLYYRDDLSIRANIATLFEACKRKTGYINADGWEFLFLKYGINELLLIDLDVKWFNTQDLKDHACDLVFEAMIAGYNPLNQKKGDYDEATQTFINLDGLSRKIDWDNLGKE